MKFHKSISAAIAASGLAIGIGLAGAAPATAATTATANLQDIPNVQATINEMSFVDARGDTFSFSVTANWQRLSDTQAVLSTIVVRPVSLPRGECLGFFDLGSTSNIGFNEGGRTLCSEGYLTYSPNATVTAYDGTTTLGQLTFRTPDPGNPLGDTGAQSLVIEYAT